jgi:hypothetical protein
MTETTSMMIKGKLALLHTMKARGKGEGVEGGSRGVASLILNRGMRWW